MVSAVATQPHFDDKDSDRPRSTRSSRTKLEVLWSITFLHVQAELVKAYQIPALHDVPKHRFT